MTGLRPRRLLAGLTGLVLLAGCSSDPKALVVPDGASWSQDNLCRVGDTQHVGFEGFVAQGGRTVHFTAVTVTGVPAGLSVRRVRAVISRENPGIPPLGSVSGDSDWQKYYGSVRLHPVADVVLDPGHPDQRWWLVAEIVQTVPADKPLKTAGLKVDYTVGDDSGSALLPYQFVSQCR